MALAEHCPYLTIVTFFHCKLLTDASVVALAEHCPHLTNINFMGCPYLTKASKVVLAKHRPCAVFRSDRCD